MQLFHEEFQPIKLKDLLPLGVFLTLLYKFQVNKRGDAEGKLIDVLNFWVETDPENSWNKLAEAVELCGYGVLAEKIRQKV